MSPKWFHFASNPTLLDYNGLNFTIPHSHSHLLLLPVHSSTRFSLLPVHRLQIWSILQRFFTRVTWVVRRFASTDHVWCSSVSKSAASYDVSLRPQLLCNDVSSVSKGMCIVCITFLLYIPQKEWSHLVKNPLRNVHFVLVTNITHRHSAAIFTVICRCKRPVPMHPAMAILLFHVAWYSSHVFLWIRKKHRLYFLQTCTAAKIDWSLVVLFAGAITDLL